MCSRRPRQTPRRVGCGTRFFPPPRPNGVICLRRIAPATSGQVAAGPTLCVCPPCARATQTFSASFQFHRRNCEFDRNGSGVDQIWTKPRNFVQIRSTSSTFLPRSNFRRQLLADSGPVLVEAGQHWQNNGQNWPNLARFSAPGATTQQVSWPCGEQPVRHLSGNFVACLCRSRLLQGNRHDNSWIRPPGAGPRAWRPGGRALGQLWRSQGGIWMRFSLFVSIHCCASGGRTGGQIKRLDSARDELGSTKILVRFGPTWVRFDPEVGPTRTRFDAASRTALASCGAPCWRMAGNLAVVCTCCCARGGRAGGLQAGYKTATTHLTVAITNEALLQVPLPLRMAADVLGAFWGQLRAISFGCWSGGRRGAARRPIARSSAQGSESDQNRWRAREFSRGSRF